MSDLYVSWSDYYSNIEKLAVKIYQSNWEFNQIVCLARGGLRIGDILSRIYRLPLAILAATSYGGSENRVRGALTFSSHITMTTSHLGSHILLVDDLVDSGVTLEQSVIWLKQNFSEQVKEIRTAVLWYKDCSVVAPDYYIDYLPDNPWVHQPFERYENMNLAELAANYHTDSNSKQPEPQR
ncbi:phosphoribosyltransferase [Phormidium sp. LEGE 05292]|uniref:phosphoribosyltransferase n=1 Tax=[Phormidium] sp. LEGE 05292 TaxID=767427 RepID=UPI00187FBD73|nr:phosphoribosyltransferase family protein [Phormidium sp. LEGE 05292]MBE9226532.1 phosphoribosyltransferase [Phormidium sp. LEGE 05292]